MESRRGGDAWSFFNGDEERRNNRPSWISSVAGRDYLDWMRVREESARAMRVRCEIKDELRSLDEEQLKKVILGEPSRYLEHFCDYEDKDLMDRIFNVVRESSSFLPRFEFLYRLHKVDYYTVIMVILEVINSYLKKNYYHTWEMVG